MDTTFVLIPEEEGKNYGTIKPVDPVNGEVCGLSVGYWRLLPPDNRIYIMFKESIDTIIHEVATTKSIRAELRAANRDNRGVEKKPIISYDPVSKKFRSVMP